MIDLIFPEIEAVYAKVPCPMKRKDNCIEKIQKLHDKWQKISKIGPNIASETLKAFQTELSQLCDLTPKDATNTISKDRSRDSKQQDEDVRFVLDQRSTRKMSMEPKLDKSFTERQQRIEKRHARSTPSASTSRANSSKSE